MTDWYETHEGLWQKAWLQLKNATALGAAERFVTLSTIHDGDQPESRLVVLRNAVKPKAELQIHTDATSKKISELRANPKAAVHHWSANLDLQIRFRGTVTISSGQQEKATWDTLPAASFASYGVTPPPGTKILTANAYNRTPKLEQFAVLTFRVTQADIVHLSPDFHRRALFERADGFKGQWLSP